MGEWEEACNFEKISYTYSYNSRQGSGYKSEIEQKSIQSNENEYQGARATRFEVKFRSVFLISKWTYTVCVFVCVKVD